MATLNHLMGLASTVIGLIGGVILVYGVAVGFARWVRTEGWYWSGRDPRGTVISFTLNWELRAEAD